MTVAREPISGFIVCFNEESHIRACIESLDFCDEVIVVDSFSADRTVDIAKEAGAQVIQRGWSGYIDQKSFGLSKTSHEWVINLDADERVSPELRDSILAVLRGEGTKDPNGKEIVGYYINRVVYYLGRWWRRGGWYPEYRLRLFKKSKVTWGGVEPHEKPEVDGATGKIEGEILHYTYDNMDEQFERLHRFSSIAAREEFKAGRRTSTSSLLLNPVLRVFKFYFMKKGYREGTAGLIVAIAEGYYTFMKYAKLWELEFNSQQDEGASRESAPRSGI